MTPTQRLILQIYGFTVAVWAIRRLALVFILPRVDRLTLQSPRFQQADPPLVTAIIPAKDEEGALEGCLSSVRAQSYANLAILVVDDRSTDGTPRIARKHAELDPRVEVLTLTDLPDGWTGKTHALSLAAERAKGDWLWFVDADTEHDPDSLAIALEYARSKQAALMSLLPRMRAESFWERIIQPLASVVLMQSYPPPLTNYDKSKLAFANGQYLLIRRDAYDAAGGHRAVRDKFVEDIHLARRVKSLGFVSRTAIGPEISSTRMYTSLGSILRGWSRILYDALDRKWWRVAAKLLDPIVFTKPSYVALPVGIWLAATRPTEVFGWCLLGLALVHHALSIEVLRKMYALCSPPGLREAIWYPLASLMMDVVLFKSLVMCLTGKVVWRGTSYGATPVVDPLADPLQSLRSSATEPRPSQST